MMAVYGTSEGLGVGFDDGDEVAHLRTPHSQGATDMTVSETTADGRARVLADGNQMPMLGLGVWQIPDGSAAVNAVRWALDLGYRHIDTAQAYGNEESVGKALRDSRLARDEVFITTKFYPARDDPVAEARQSRDIGAELGGVFRAGPDPGGVSVVVLEHVHRKVVHAVCHRAGKAMDSGASAEMARRLIALQRQRLAEGQVIDRRARRALHDEILPRLHTAMLSLDGGTADQLQSLVQGSLDAGHKLLVFDLTALTFVSSAGLSVFLLAYRRLQGKGEVRFEGVAFRYGDDAPVPKALTDYIKGRESYDYNEHGRAGNSHTAFVPDAIVDRFCLIGPPEAHVARLDELAALGVDQFALYLQHDDKDGTLRSYGEQQSPLTLRAELGLGAAEVSQLVPGLAERLGERPPAVDSSRAGEPPVDLESARFRLFDAVSRFLRNAAQAQPLLLLLDDLHWADKVSLLLLQFLSGELSEAKLLLVGMYRDTDLDRHHPLAEALPSLRRTPGFERLLLRGLGRDDVERLLQSRAGHELDGRAVTVPARDPGGGAAARPARRRGRLRVDPGQCRRRSGRCRVRRSARSEAP